MNVSTNLPAFCILYVSCGLDLNNCQCSLMVHTHTQHTLINPVIIAHHVISCICLIISDHVYSPLFTPELDFEVFSKCCSFVIGMEIGTAISQAEGM